MPRSKEDSEYGRFDEAMDKILSVSHTDLKVLLDAEKAAKVKKQKAKKAKK